MFNARVPLRGIYRAGRSKSILGEMPIWWMIRAIGSMRRMATIFHTCSINAGSGKTILRS
jgi:hypothetical protein